MLSPNWERSTASTALLSLRRVRFAFISCFFFAAINHGPMLWRYEAPGDLGDARFNLSILEHLFQWVSGTVILLSSPSMFYPFPDTLFFSDTHFGSAIFYI